MEHRGASGILRAELNAAIEEGLARYSHAVQHGDADAMEVEQEHQTRLDPPVAHPPKKG